MIGPSPPGAFSSAAGVAGRQRVSGGIQCSLTYSLADGSTIAPALSAADSVILAASLVLLTLPGPRMLNIKIPRQTMPAATAIGKSDVGVLSWGKVHSPGGERGRPCRSPRGLQTKYIPTIGFIGIAAFGFALRSFVTCSLSTLVGDRPLP
jgi:hypothetical protein